MDLEEAARDAVEAARSSVGEARSFTLVFHRRGLSAARCWGRCGIAGRDQNVVFDAVKYSGEGDSTGAWQPVERNGLSEVADTGIRIPGPGRQSDVGGAGARVARRTLGSGGWAALVLRSVEELGTAGTCLTSGGVGNVVLTPPALPGEHLLLEVFPSRRREPCPTSDGLVGRERAWY